MTTVSNNPSQIRRIVVIISLLMLTLASVFLSRRSVNDIQQASASIYKDRLIPTGLLVNLTATVYQKRLLLETYVLAGTKPNVESTVSSLNRLNRRTDSLLTEFEQTRLTAKEVDGLHLLKQRLAIYNQVEGEFTTNLINWPAAQQKLFAGSGGKAFGQVAQTLDELASLQLTVGEDLVDESSGQSNYIYVLTALQIGLVLLVGLILFWYRL